ncbi:MAG: NTP transferase domain-containing protein [Deltaproteobacteria bacterium]|nr:NTP transferase domain-containing protein [Deltaproteobacteria bacterium]
MKVLILVVGRGNRINEFSENRNKCMVSLKGRPLLEYALLRMAEAALSELVVMFGYKAIEIINHFGIRYGNKRIRYVIQKDQKGLVHAIGCAKDVFEGENFFLALGEEGLTDARCDDIILFFKNNMRPLKKVHFCSARGRRKI